LQEREKRDRGKEFKRGKLKGPSILRCGGGDKFIQGKRSEETFFVQCQVREEGEGQFRNHHQIHAFFFGDGGDHTGQRERNIRHLGGPARREKKKGPQDAVVSNADLRGGQVE